MSVILFGCRILYNNPGVQFTILLKTNITKQRVNIYSSLNLILLDRRHDWRIIALVVFMRDASIGFGLRMLNEIPDVAHFINLASNAWN